MDYIDEHLATIAANSITYSVAIQAAAGVAKRLMNKYYSATDLSEVYRISMSMFTLYHPLELFLTSNCSSSSSPQAFLFQESGMGAEVD